MRSPKQPIIGEVFATQAGIHQTGISRQGEAGGGPIYLPFDAGLVGEEVVELNRIGALSGMDGMSIIPLTTSPLECTLLP